MPTGPEALLVLVMSGAVTFIAARTLSSWWRRRNAQKRVEEALAAESRQVRRARERRERGQ